MAATLRPETMAGQTNCWVLPEGDYGAYRYPPPPVQPSRIVQPDAVCEVGSSTPDLSYGDLGIFPGGRRTEKIVH